MFLLVSVLAVLGFGQTRAVVNSENSYAQVDMKDFASRPAECQGRRVTVTAEVVSVSADYRELNVFDSRSKALIGVSLTQLSKAQRHALIAEPVHHVAVYGRVEMKNGQVVIKADMVMPVSASLVAKR